MTEAERKLQTLREPLTMSMFRNAGDLAAEALRQRAEAAEWISRLLPAKPTGECLDEPQGNSGRPSNPSNTP